MAAQTVYIVRHGEYVNPRYLIPGRSLGYPLSDRGRSQVAMLRDTLYPGARIQHVIASPLLRTRQTADILAAPFGVRVELDERLIEVRTTLEGTSMTRMDETNGELSYLSEYQARGAESMQELADRVYGAVEAIRSLRSGQNVLIVTHGDPMRFAVMTYLGIPITFPDSRSISTPLAGGYRLVFPSGGTVSVYPIVAS